MGIKELWTVLAPYSERKSLHELRGKTVAIDLAGWVCENLNVVDYTVSPQHHLKNLFHRTSNLLFEGITPIFVLEGEAPTLKAEVIAKRGNIQFRGVKPRESPPTQVNSSPPKDVNKKKRRNRFNNVLKQCAELLQSMGVLCIKGPGEGEAYCAYLNKRGLVDGVISQDSDCFAYGAVKVYRNFSISSNKGGFVDVYDMNKVCRHIDFGQNKIIVMGLLCGCDYCPDGVGGAGRDGVLKLFARYKNDVIIERLKCWRQEGQKYSQLEMKVDNRKICSYCGHLGTTASHTKSGCATCRTSAGCDSSLWMEERLALKAEIALREKALKEPNFPSEEIINEFLREPDTVPSLDVKWKQPNLVKFVRLGTRWMQWPEIYCFQKFFPLLTCWQVSFIKALPSSEEYVVVEEIIKKRTVRGTPSLEVRWKDEKGFFDGLIPDEQFKRFADDHPKGIQELWTTIEALNLLENAYPDKVRAFLASKEKPKKAGRAKAKLKIKEVDENSGDALNVKEKAKKPKARKPAQNDSLNDMSALLDAANEIAKTVVPKQKPKKGLQMISKFLKPKGQSGQAGSFNPGAACSTPKAKGCPSDLDSDCDEDFDMSGIINEMIKNTAPPILRHEGRFLRCEAVKLQYSFDDLDLLMESKKRNLSLSILDKTGKKICFDDSIDRLIAGNGNSDFRLTHAERFLNIKHSLERSRIKKECLLGDSVSAVEKSMDIVSFRETKDSDGTSESSKNFSDL